MFFVFPGMGVVGSPMCNQILHVGETGKQLLVKNQGVVKQLISYWVPSFLLEWFLWEVSLRH